MNKYLDATLSHILVSIQVLCLKTQKSYFAAESRSDISPSDSQPVDSLDLATFYIITLGYFTSDLMIAHIGSTDFQSPRNIASLLLNSNVQF
jgi:hypothetical protein